MKSMPAPKLAQLKEIFETGRAKIVREPKKISTASCKAKARKQQQHIAARIVQVCGLEEEDARSVSMGAQGADIMLSPAAKKVFPFRCECKRRKRFDTIYQWVKQARGPKNEEPVVFFRGDREEGLVIITEDAFFDFIKHTQQAMKDFENDENCTDITEYSDDELEKVL